MRESDSMSVGVIEHHGGVFTPSPTSATSAATPVSDGRGRWVFTLNMAVWRGFAARKLLGFVI